MSVRREVERDATADGLDPQRSPLLCAPALPDPHGARPDDVSFTGGAQQRGAYRSLVYRQGDQPAETIRLASDAKQGSIRQYQQGCAVSIASDVLLRSASQSSVRRGDACSMNDINVSCSQRGVQNAARCDDISCAESESCDDYSRAGVDACGISRADPLTSFGRQPVDLTIGQSTQFQNQSKIFHSQSSSRRDAKSHMGVPVESGIGDERRASAKKLTYMRSEAVLPERNCRAKGYEQPREDTAAVMVREVIRSVSPGCLWDACADDRSVVMNSRQQMSTAIAAGSLGDDQTSSKRPFVSRSQISWKQPDFRPRLANVDRDYEALSVHRGGIDGTDDRQNLCRFSDASDRRGVQLPLRTNGGEDTMLTNEINHHASVAAGGCTGELLGVLSTPRSATVVGNLQAACMLESANVKCIRSNVADIMDGGVQLSSACSSAVQSGRNREQFKNGASTQSSIEAESDELRRRLLQHQVELNQLEAEVQERYQRTSQRQSTSVRRQHETRKANDAAAGSLEGLRSKHSHAGDDGMLTRYCLTDVEPVFQNNSKRSGREMIIPGAQRRGMGVALSSEDDARHSSSEYSLLPPANRHVNKEKPIQRIGYPMANADRREPAALRTAAHRGANETLSAQCAKKGAHRLQMEDEVETRSGEYCSVPEVLSSGRHDENQRRPASRLMQNNGSGRAHSQICSIDSRGDAQRFSSQSDERCRKTSESDSSRMRNGTASRSKASYRRSSSKSMQRGGCMRRFSSSSSSGRRRSKRRSQERQIATTITETRMTRLRSRDDRDAEDRRDSKSDSSNRQRNHPSDERSGRSHGNINHPSRNRRGDGPPSGGDSGDGDEPDRRPRDHSRQNRYRRQSRRPNRRDGGSSPSPGGSSDGERRPTNRRSEPSRWMKPDKFDGKGSFETFLCQFENCIKYNKWNADDQIAHLRWSLSGIAAQFLWGTEDLSYHQLVEKLRGRFGGKGLEEKYQNELRCRRRASNESLRELAQDIQRLMALAYPGERSNLSEHIARDAFLTALDDPEFELKVREREPADLESAVKLAQRFEIFKSAVESKDNSRRRVIRHVVGGVDEVVTPTDIEARLVNLERNLCEETPRMSNPGPRMLSGVQKKTEYSPSPTPNSNPIKSRAAPIAEEEQLKEEINKQSYELQMTQRTEEGHLQSVLAENDALHKEIGRLQHLEQMRSTPPWTTRGSSYTQKRPAISGAGLCYNCNQPGHYARICPNPLRPRRYVQNPQILLENADVSHFPRKVNDENPSLRVSGVTTRRSGLGVHPTYLKAIIGSKECYCLLDTGSEASLLPAAIIDPSHVTRSSKTMMAANGTPIPLLGEVTVPMRIGGLETTVRGLVSEHIVEVMLGIDWLTENEVKWEFDKAQILINNEYHRLLVRAGESQWCRRVTLQEDVTIPPRSEMNVLTKVICRPWEEVTEESQWGTEPATLVSGVHVSRTLIPRGIVRDVLVRVVNVLLQPVSLSEGTVVADLQPVSVVGCFPPEKQHVVEREQSEKEQSTDPVPDYIEQMMMNVHPSVPESTVLALESLLMRYKDVFSQCEDDLGLTNIVQHHIDTGSATPIRQQLRRFPPAHVQAISQHVDSMISQGVIEPACSPWASNIVLVRKKDGSFRCCIDYRQLNSATRKDAYPLPRIDACLDAMASAKWFSTFDLRSSYHQVQVYPPDMDKTAFICPRGMFRFRTMPFGLCNAGATFQRLMDIVMTGLNLNICLVYLDDIIVYSTTLSQHLEHLMSVLERLRSAGLKLKPEKCNLYQKSVSFLGHVISSEGIGTDPQKTQTVVEWSTPTCAKDVKSFLGLASYYRRFVKDFATIAAPLQTLVKKNEVFKWNEDAQRSFDALKDALTSPPILAMPTDTDEFTLDTDASDFAIGAVLSQKQDGIERVVAYASRSLDRRERNYCVTRKELLAVVHFLRFFKQYLLGRHVKVRTDHAALSWLRHTPDPIGQQARWLEQMEEFDFEVQHRSGKQHGNADALSRIPCLKRDCRCQESNRVNGYGVSGHGVSAFGGPADRLESASDYKARNIQISQSDNTCKSSEPTKFLVVADVHREDVRSPEPTLETIVLHGSSVRCMGVRNVAAIRTNASDDVPEGANQSDNNSSMTIGPQPNTVLPWSKGGLVAAQRHDTDIGCIMVMLENSQEKPHWESVALKSIDVKILWNQWNRLAMRDGLLKRRFESVDGHEVRWQVVWPKELRMEFLQIAHSGMTGGHLARRRTAAAVQSRAYWPTWSSDLASFMKRCEPCARYHRGKIRHQVPMQISLVGEPWQRISVDITGPHPRSSRSNQYILTVVDHFSKWAEAIPLANHTAPVVARALMNHVFTRFGAPQQLLTDRGPEFESELFRQLMKWMEIDKLRTTPYKPSTNGVVERFHRTLNSMLGKVVNESHRDWDERLPCVLAAYRASPHASTGFSPNQLFLGREVRMPLDLIMGLEEDAVDGVRSADQYVAEIKERAEDCYNLAREHLRVAAERRKKSYDIRVRNSEFTVGDWVWYWYPRRYQRKSPKWQKMFTGPYLIIRVIEPVNYVLQKSARAKPFVVHTDKIKRCFGEVPASWLTPTVTSNDSTPEAQALVEERQIEEAPLPMMPNNVAISPTGSTLGPHILTEPELSENDVDETRLCGNDNAPCIVNTRPRRHNRRMPRNLTDFVCT